MSLKNVLQLSGKQSHVTFKSAFLAHLDAWTFSCWIHPERAKAGTHPNFHKMIIYSEGIPEITFCLAIEDDGKLFLASWNLNNQPDNWTWLTEQAMPKIDFGGWNYIAVTYQGKTSRDVVVYVNEQKIADTLKTYEEVKDRLLRETPRRSTMSASLGINIGARVQTEQGGLTGMIADVGIWNYARSEVEIKETMYARRLPPDPRRMAYWTCDSSSGKTLPGEPVASSGAIRDSIDQHWDAFHHWNRSNLPVYDLETARRCARYSQLAYETRQDVLKSALERAAAPGSLLFFKSNLVPNPDIQNGVVEYFVALEQRSDHQYDLILSFRGTDDFLTNDKDPLGKKLWISLSPLVTRDQNDPPPDQIVSGFQKAYRSVKAEVFEAFFDAALDIIDAMGRQATTPSTPPAPAIRLLVTGHSLGGAIAVYTAFNLAGDPEVRKRAIPVELYVYGIPRVGDHAFATKYQRRLSGLNSSFSFYNTNDGVYLLEMGKQAWLPEPAYANVGNHVRLSLTHAPRKNPQESHAIDYYLELLNAIA